MAVNRDIIVKLRLAGEDFDRDFKIKFQDLTTAAEKASEQSGSRAGSNFGKSFAKAAGTAAGAAGAAIGLAINQASNLGAELASTSRQFNVNVEALQVWRQAAASAGVSASDLNGAFGSLTQRIGEANDGNRQAQQSFADLGIGFKTTAGEARATDAVMLDLAKRISDIKDPSERVRVGAQLLGDEFKTLYPLLLDGADGVERARIELGQFGAILTQEEIRNLEKTNTKIEQMKTVLSIRVAGVVAENADAIFALTDRLLKFGVAAVDAANAWLGVQSAFGSDFNRQVAALPANLSFLERERQVQRLAGAAYRDRGQVVADDGFGGFFGQIRDTSKRTPGTGDMTFYTPWHRQQVRDFLLPGRGDVEVPRVTGGGGGTRRSGGGSRAPRETPEQRAARVANEQALRNEEQLREAIARTLREQEDSVRIARTRAEQGEVAAAMLEAELNLTRQFPQLQAKTVEELAKALGYTKELTDEKRKQLEADLAAGRLAMANATSAAQGKAWGDVLADAADRYRDAERDAAEAAREWERAHTDAVLNVADIYETAFRGGTNDLWRGFKDEGTRIIAEIAAQWTLAMIAGQPFSFNAAASSALGPSPLSSIFAGAGGPANDNGAGFPGFGGGIFGTGGGIMTATSNLQLGGSLAGSYVPVPAAAAAKTPFLQSKGFAIGLGTLAGSFAGNGGMASQIGGLAGSVGGQALGSSIAALGSFGGPVGAILGGVLGSVLPSLLSSPKRASVTIGGAGGTLGITGRQGNSSSREQTATQGAGSLIDAIFQIANQLGGEVDASRGSVSFGVRKNSFRVDPSGRGVTKIGSGAVDFGSDQEAAMRFAIGDLIKDGVITGISQASQNLLQKGGDLDKQIEKALLIEEIPKLLRQRTDPLGAALDDLADKFGKVNDALVEGGASAEQFAQARQLWKLERDETIESFGTASRSLKDFLSALNAGSSSPLSLREQREEAERQLQPFIGQISAAESARAEADRLRASGASAAQIAAAEEAARTAAGAINQEGFTQASQLLLSISRQTGASSGAYFSDFDRVRALTGQAISFVDQASNSGSNARDPFASETAKNTKDAALILSDLSAESRAQGETLRQIAASLSGSSGDGFIGAPRAFRRA